MKSKFIILTILSVFLCQPLAAETMYLEVDFPLPHSTYKKFRMQPHADNFTADDCNETDEVGKFGYHFDTDNSINELKICTDTGWNSITGLWTETENPSDIHNIHLVNDDLWSDNNPSGEYIRLRYGPGVDSRSNFHVTDEELTGSHKPSSNFAGLLIEGDYANLHMIGLDTGNNTIALSASDNLGSNKHWLINRFGATAIPPNRLGFLYGTSTGDFDDNTNIASQEHFSILSTGHIGVGTNDPLASLHVQNNVDSDDITITSPSPSLLFNNTNADADKFRFQVENNEFSMQYKAVVGGVEKAWTPFFILDNLGRLTLGPENSTTNQSLFHIEVADNIPPNAEDAHVVLRADGPSFVFHDRNDDSFLIKPNEDLFKFKSGTYGSNFAAINAFTDVFTLTSDGELGLGTDSPAAVMDVSLPSGTTDEVLLGSSENVSILFRHPLPVAATDVNFLINTDQNDFWRLFSSTGTGPSDGFQDRLTISADGFVGIRESNPQAAVHVGDDAVVRLTNSRNIIKFTDQTPGTSNFEITCCDDDSLSIEVSPDSAIPFGAIITLTSNRMVGIGTTTPTEELDVVGNANVSGCYEAGGSLWDGLCASDKRLKENIEPLQGSLEKIKHLNPVTFNYNPKENIPGNQTGLIAQNVKETIPELVTTNEDGDLSIYYGVDMQIHLLQATQELINKTNQLEKDIDQIENEL